MAAAVEEELLQRAKNGEQAAFEAVLSPHLPMLYAYAKAVSGDHHLTEDTVQETALIAFRNLNNLFPEADFATWLRAIARRQALSARRSSNRLHPLVDNALEAAYEDSSPEHLSPQREALRACVETLGDRARSVIKAHYFTGAGLREMTASFKLNANTLKTILFRSRLVLEDCVRRRLGSGGGAPVEFVP